MTAENFIYWCQGFLEIQNPHIITVIQVKEIQNHIDLVLNKTISSQNTAETVKNMQETNKKFTEDFPPFKPAPILYC